MPDWQNQPANRLYKRALADMRVALPHWWPTRPHAEVVGGDIDAGAVIMHLPFEGTPYLARLPADGSYPGNTDVTMRDLHERLWSCEWTDGTWRWILLCRREIDSDDLAMIRSSMTEVTESADRRRTEDTSAHPNLVPLHRILRSVRASGGPPFRRSGASAGVPSIELDDVVVKLTVTVRDPSYMGTFDEGGVQWLQLILSASTAGTRPRFVALPHGEQITWVRAVLGELADFAYKIVTDRELVRPGPAHFLVLVDGHGRPQLAPSDFEWFLASGGGHRAYPEKVVPQDPELLAQLRKHGDLIDPDSVRHPRQSPPAVWAQQFLSQLTATFADHLGRVGDGRYITVDEVGLHGTNRVVVQYTRHTDHGDERFGFDIDLGDLRERRLRDADDTRPGTAARVVGSIPFGEPTLRPFTEVDGVKWILLYEPDESGTGDPRPSLS